MVLKKILKFLTQPFGHRGAQPYTSFATFREQFKKQSGVALIIAVMTISIIMMFAVDFIVSSNLEFKMAVIQRENVKAEYLAKSGANLAIFLISADYGVDLFMASPQSPAKTAMTDNLGDFWGMINGLPIGSDNAKKVGEMFKLGAVMDEEVINQMKQLDGEFVVDVQDEQSKINVNYCVHGRDCPEVMAMMDSLMNCPVEKVFLERKEVKWRELAYKIKDFVDKNSTAEPFSGLSDEAEPYRKKKIPYSPKDAPLDSVDELRLVDGWDRDIHTVFSRYMTVYPFQDANKTQVPPKININTAPRELLSCLFSDMKADCREKSIISLNERDDKKSSSVATEKDIADFVKKNFCYTPPAGTAAPGTDKTKWFDVKTTVFRIKVRGQSGDQEKNLEVVVERRAPDLAKNIKSSFRVLYSRML